MYKKILIILGSLISIYLLLYLIAFIYPKLKLNHANSFYIYDIYDNAFKTNKDDWISINEVSDNIINATISIEDKNFYTHKGFDYPRIIKALYQNIKNNKVIEGASTITQQYVKNLYLNFDRTFKRKIEEAWLTLRMETHYSKDEILEGYLNTINYGGVFGIENASEYYFSKSSKDLTLAEASMLAGIPKSPSNYEPIGNTEKAKARQLAVLNSMIKNGYITEEEKEIAYNTELNYNTNKNNNLDSIMYYQDASLEELKTLNIPESVLYKVVLKYIQT